MKLMSSSRDFGRKIGRFLAAGVGKEKKCFRLENLWEIYDARRQQ